MVSGVTNPETSGSSGLDPRQRCGTAIADPLPPMKICKTKPSEARMSFRINKTIEKNVKNEAK